jgi:Mg2+/Co2+ transporter CorB
MLLSLLDLEKATVEDIMVPRNEIVGIDIDGDWDAVNAQLNNNQHTRLPVYRESIDHVIGFLHMRSALEMVMHKDFSRDSLLKIIREPYFVPENTPLNKQLLNFQREKRRIAMVVDEYGDIMGLVTLEDILEEIVGEFTSDPAASFKDVLPQADGSYLVDGSANIREINRLLGWKLPTDGPKTLNGLILEYLETIPESGTSLLLSGHPVEIMQVKENAVKTARIMPSITPGPQTPDQPPA